MSALGGKAGTLIVSGVGGSFFGIRELVTRNSLIDLTIGDKVLEDEAKNSNVAPPAAPPPSHLQTLLIFNKINSNLN